MNKVIPNSALATAPSIFVSPDPMRYRWLQCSNPCSSEHITLEARGRQQILLVWPGRALQAESDDLEVVGLALLPSLSFRIYLDWGASHPTPTSSSQRCRTCSSRLKLSLLTPRQQDLAGRRSIASRKILRPLRLLWRRGTRALSGRRREDCEEPMNRWCVP